MKFIDGSELLCAPMNFNTKLGVALVRRLEDGAVETIATYDMSMPEGLREALDKVRPSTKTVFADRVNGRLTGR